MMTATKKSSEIRDMLIAHLRDINKRSTPERLAVIDAIAHRAGLFSVADILDDVNRMSFAISMASVYNTINLFVADNVLYSTHKPGSTALVYEVPTPDDVSIFSVCDLCGKSRRLRAPEISRMIRQYDCGSFSPTSYSLTVHGLCRGCAKKSKLKTEN